MRYITKNNAFYLSFLWSIFPVHLKLDCGKWWMWKCPHEVKCIELYSVCDGSKDCFFGGDEGNKLCTESFCKNVLGGRWKCPYEAKCIFKFQVCNADSDCEDGADETEHACTQDICNDSGRWKCPGENMCLNHDSVCNSRQDCIDGADETDDACKTACQIRGQIACLATSHNNSHKERKQILSSQNKCIEWKLLCNEDQGYFGTFAQNRCNNRKEEKDQACTHIPDIYKIGSNYPPLREGNYSFRLIRQDYID